MFINFRLGSALILGGICLASIFMACGNTAKKEAQKPVKVVLQSFQDSTKQDSAMIIPEQSAQFEGGMPAFFKYVSQNIKFPEQAKRMGVNSKLFLEFVVNKDGAVSEIKVLRSLEPSFDNAVIDILKSSPKWIPAKHKGKTVRQKMTLPIYIKLR